MQDCCYPLSYWGQIFVIIWVMYSGLLLPIELLGPEFCCHKSYIHAGLLLPIELLGPDFCYHMSYVCRIAVIELFQGPDFCYHKSYYAESLLPIELLGQISVIIRAIMQNHCYLLSYWGQISVIIRVMFAGFQHLGRRLGTSKMYLSPPVA